MWGKYYYMFNEVFWFGYIFNKMVQPCRRILCLSQWFFEKLECFVLLEKGKFTGVLVHVVKYLMLWAIQNVHSILHVQELIRYSSTTWSNPEGWSYVIVGAHDCDLSYLSIIVWHW